MFYFFTDAKKKRAVFPILPDSKSALGFLNRPRVKAKEDSDYTKMFGVSAILANLEQLLKKEDYSRLSRDEKKQFLTGFMALTQGCFRAMTALKCPGIDFSDPKYLTDKNDLFRRAKALVPFYQAEIEENNQFDLRLNQIKRHDEASYPNKKRIFSRTQSERRMLVIPRLSIG